MDFTEGIELAFAANGLGYYLLTIELLDLLVASAPASIANAERDSMRVQKYGG